MALAVGFFFDRNFRAPCHLAFETFRSRSEKFPFDERSRSMEQIVGPSGPNEDQLN